MSQTSDKSRTFRVLNLTDEVKTELTKLNSVVTQHENINYVEVSSVDGIDDVKSVLDSNDMKYKQCSYSTFVRFKDELTLSQLNETANKLCKNVNILYSRIDENNHTGKLVVDKLEDYNMLKSNTGDISFYRFSPVNVSSNAPRTNQPRNENSGEWQTVNKNTTVRGRYAQAVGGTPAPRGAAPTRGGRGGARGGMRGAPRTRAAPAS
jgi:hypothetical protein